MFRHRGTSESDVGSPLIPLNEFATRRSSAEGFHGRESGPWLLTAPAFRRATGGCAFSPLGIRVQAISPLKAIPSNGDSGLSQLGLENKPFPHFQPSNELLRSKQRLSSC